MIEWINNRFGTTYSTDDLDEIKNFTLLWNIYENIIFNTRFSINQLEAEIENRDLNYEDFRLCFEYFQNRYVEDGQINNRFQYLIFRPNNREEFVRGILTAANPIPNNKILTAGIIVYRLRNNLFHGIKDYRNLDGQVENFTHANSFIQNFL